MRRIGIIVLSVVLLCGAFGATIAMAQDATPAAAEDHPIVGAWLLDTDIDDPTNPFSLDVFTSDGVYFEVDPEGGTSVGVWEPSGANTANMTFWGLDPSGGMLIVRAELEVGADGRTVTGTYTVEFIEPDGTVSGEIGPGNVEGTKLAVEPQGDPIGSFEDVFGAPEATPAG